MMKTWYRNLQEFIEVLEAKGELVRVKEPVSRELEITEITDRMSKQPGGGKALLFENVKESAYPVLTNAYGSMRRISLALGCERDVDELAVRLQEILDQAPPLTFKDKMAMLPKALEYSRFLPKIISGGTPACQEVIQVGEAINLDEIPVLKCWPDDGGPFVTLPVVFTRDPDQGKRNVGMYRMQIFDKNTTGMHWHIHKDGSHYWQEYRKQGRRMEVAVAIGTDPAITYAATAPMPRGLDEMLLAGFIRQKPVELVKGVTVDIEVPAEAEFVIEGYVDPGELRNEGPFGDHTGYYSLEGDYPVFHVTAITHRRNPVYFATVVGRPPMEDCYLAYATERMFVPPLRLLLPEVKDYWLPWEGVFHNIVAVAIDKEFPHHADKVLSALWGSGQMSFAKSVTLVDDPALLGDGKRLLRHILDTVDFAADITITRGVLDVLDHSAPQPLYGAKLGIDATARIDGEAPRPEVAPVKLPADKDLLAGLQRLDEGVRDLSVWCRDARRPIVTVGVAKDETHPSQHWKDLLAGHPDILGGAVWVFYDEREDQNDASLLLWKAFNNVDPARDTALQTSALIDATRKIPADGHNRPWPEDIEMTEEIKQRVAPILHGLGIV